MTSDSPPARSGAALFALLIGAFAVGMTEFVIAGLLPAIATDFDVSISVAGFLVSGYALSVAIGGPVFAVLTARLPRKTLLIAVMVLFVVANAGAAVAPSYALLLLARIVSAFAHGIFFGVGSVIATQLAKPGRGGAAIAMIISGIAIANVLGIPFGTLVGDRWGWRATFWVIAAIGAVAVLMIIVTVPSSLRRLIVRFRDEVAVLARPTVSLTLTFTLFGYSGVAMILTYISPMLTEVSGLPGELVPLALLLFGAGLLLGGPVGGRLGDRNLMRTLVIMATAITGTLVVLSLVMTSTVGTLVALVALGVFGGAILPTSQLSVIREAHGGENLASSLNVTATNLGIAGGAAIGAAVIASPLGIAGIGWAAAGITVFSVAASVVLSRAVARRPALVDA